jgi:hypothetical protein
MFGFHTIGFFRQDDGDAGDDDVSSDDNTDILSSSFVLLVSLGSWTGVEFKQKLQLASRTSRYKNQLAPRYSTSPTIMGHGDNY